MVHKEQYQRLADWEAQKLGGYALHIGKIGEEEFVYSFRKPSSSDFDPENQTLITVEGNQAKVLTGYEAKALLPQVELREFSTGRSIYKKYPLMIKNHSFIIGEGPEYAQAIVDAIESKRIKPAVMYQYLEIAEHNRKKLKIDGSVIEIV